MKIFILSWLPLSPVDSGYKKRVTELALALKRYGAEIQVLSPGEPVPGIPHRMWESLVAENAHPSMVTRNLPKGRLLAPRKRVVLEEAAKIGAAFKPDWVIAEGLWAIPAASKAAKTCGVKMAVTVHNLEGLSARGVYPFPIPTTLGRFEYRAYSQADHVLAMSDEERDLLAGKVSGCKGSITVVPNGARSIPLEMNSERRAETRTQWNVKEDQLVGLFLGRLDYPPNRKGLEWFSREVVPNIPDSDRQRFVWKVVGRPVPSEPMLPLDFLGFVEDLEPVFEAADFVFSPILHGSGTALKVLDSLAAGLPLVSTPHG
ncbi:MAG: glycosyltransferase family 4 protein, partial [Candidatus Omnitrophica bacterium]|nr:glycosyltransferase family 4 protein [Candidatus Omnitrophota bacterium]